MKKPRLPSSVSDVWPGGFVVFDGPRHVAHVAAAGGTVVAASDQWIYLLRPGAAGFVARETPPGFGDVYGLAVEPRRQPRLAVAGLDDVLIFDGARIDRVRFDVPGAEVREIAWVRGLGGGKGFKLCAHMDVGSVFIVDPDDQSVSEAKLPPVRAIATDEAGNFVWAVENEEEDILEVHANNEQWIRTLPIPDFMIGAKLAVAGRSVAVSFPRDRVYVSRGVQEIFSEVEVTEDAGPVAFQGGFAGAALFGASHEKGLTGIVRVDAQGTVQRIGEIGAEGGATPRIVGFAWDGSRHTLWTAAGEAGLAYSTAPGAKSPLGAGAPS
jgi:hypothetical protein